MKKRTAPTIVTYLSLVVLSVLFLFGTSHLPTLKAQIAPATTPAITNWTTVLAVMAEAQKELQAYKTNGSVSAAQYAQLQTNYNNATNSLAQVTALYNNATNSLALAQAQTGTLTSEVQSGISAANQLQTNGLLNPVSGN